MSIGRCKYCGEAFSASSRAKLGAAISLHLPVCPKIEPILPPGFITLEVAAVRLGLSTATVRRRAIAWQEHSVFMYIRTKINNFGRVFYCESDCMALYTPESPGEEANKPKRRGRKRVLFTHSPRGRGDATGQRQLSIG